MCALYRLRQCLHRVAALTRTQPRRSRRPGGVAQSAPRRCRGVRAFLPTQVPAAGLLPQSLGVRAVPPFFTRAGSGSSTAPPHPYGQERSRHQPGPRRRGRPSAAIPATTNSSSSGDADSRRWRCDSGSRPAGDARDRQPGGQRLTARLRTPWSTVTNLPSGVPAAGGEWWARAQSRIPAVESEVAGMGVRLRWLRGAALHHLVRPGRRLARPRPGPPPLPKLSLLRSSNQPLRSAAVAQCALRRYPDLADNAWMHMGPSPTGWSRWCRRPATQRQRWLRVGRVEVHRGRRARLPARRGRSLTALQRQGGQRHRHAGSDFAPVRGPLDTSGPRTFSSIRFPARRRPSGCAMPARRKVSGWSRRGQLRHQRPALLRSIRALRDSPLGASWAANVAGLCRAARWNSTATRSCNCASGSVKIGSGRRRYRRIMSGDVSRSLCRVTCPGDAATGGTVGLHAGTRPPRSWPGGGRRSSTTGSPKGLALASGAVRGLRRRRRCRFSRACADPEHSRPALYDGTRSLTRCANSTPGPG